jgi:Na+-exporting ATPase
MVAKKAWVPAKGTYSVGTTDSPHDPTVGSLSFTPKPPSQIDMEKEGEESTHEQLLEKNTHLLEYLKVASLANLAHVHPNEEEGGWNARGDPTEIAIQVLASRFKWNRLDYTEGESPRWKQLAEFPFDSDVKKMSVVFEEAETSHKYVFTKGAVERVSHDISAMYETLLTTSVL